jgi:predicted permease
MSVDTGFVRDGVVTATINRPPKGYDSASTVWNFEQQVLARVRAAPGVIDAAGTSSLPLQRGWNLPITGERADLTEGAIELRALSPGYFKTLGMRLLRGRDVSDDDRQGSTPVVVISQTVANRYFPGQDPIGRTIAVGKWHGQSVAATLDEPPRQIVGIVADIRDISLEREPMRTVFVPQAQVVSGLVTLPAFVVRTTRPSDAAVALRQAVREVDPRIRSLEVSTLDEVIASSLDRRRFTMTLMSTFAGVALVLTIVGIYGVVAYAVARRVREIGLRIALGAHPSRVVALVARQGVWPVVVGVSIGLVVTVGVTRVLQTMLYEVSPHDPVVLARAAVLLVGLALLA